MSQPPALEESSLESDISNLPPGRIKAVRGGQERLNAPPGLSNILRRKAERLSSPRSRSRSPGFDANSSISSLDDIVDQDILLDRQGFGDLDLTAEQRKMHSSREFVNLPPVNERMTEDSLEDIHAFSDLPTNTSRANSLSIATGGEAYLEALDECEEEGEDDDLSDVEEEPVGQIILTNMENLTLEQEPAVRGTRGTGESSLLEEAPSAPTA